MFGTNVLIKDFVCLHTVPVWSGLPWDFMLKIVITTSSKIHQHGKNRREGKESQRQNVVFFLLHTGVPEVWERDFRRLNCRVM